MRKLKVRVGSLEAVKKDIFLLGFESPYLAEASMPGQFLHLRVNSPELILRRPLSIHKIDKKKVYILFRIRGKGTEALSQISKGDFLDILGPLGKEFTYTRTPHDASRKTIVMAGGMGVAPLLFLAQKLVKVTKSQRHPSTPLRAGKVTRPSVILGVKTKDEVVCEHEFKKLGCKVLIATEDGSRGFKGQVTDLLRNLLSTQYSVLSPNIYACGPKDMFLEISKILKKRPRVDCQVSFEQFMGCGIGVCRACAIKTKQGYARVCKDGPVFNIKDVF